MVWCPICNDHFCNQGDLESHYDQAHHWCRTCNKLFKNDNDLHEHRRQSPTHSSSYCCSPCRRLFQSEAHLSSHKNSSVHRPKDIICPGQNCSEGFVSQSALVLHWEAGSCSSGINRSIVNSVIRERDTNNAITDPSRLLTGPGQGSYDETSLYATSASWNGRAFECYLCHNPFNSLRGLNQHLASPRHQEKIYVCALSSCKERFGALSGLCQHIESGRCGVLKFETVRRALDGFVGGVKTVTAC